MNIEIMKNKDLKRKQKMMINQGRVINWGKSAGKDFDKDYEADTLWFFVKDKGKVVSLGGIRPLKVRYKEKEYKIGGICSTISLVGKKGYGSILIKEMIKYSKENEKTILGFTTQTKFFEKAGLGTRKKFIKRFVWVKEDGEKVFDDDGDGIYFEGKDLFVSKVLKGRGFVSTRVDFW